MASNNDIEMEVIKKEPKEEEETSASENQEQDLILNCEVKNENVKTEETTAKDDEEHDFLLNCEVKNENGKMEETTAKDDPDEMVNGRGPNVRLETNATPRRPYGKARLNKHLRIIKKYGVRNKRELWRINCTLRETHEAARELLTPEEEKARFDQELKIIDKYGLRNKRELWRAKCTLSKTQKAARELQEKGLLRDHVLLRRLVRVGVLHKDSMKLVYVLALKIEDFLERRLQTVVFKMGLAKSIHQAGVLIRQRHIRVCEQVVKSPSYIVPLECQKHINISLESPFGGGCAGRIKRKNLRKSAAGGVVEEEAD